MYFVLLIQFSGQVTVVLMYSLLCSYRIHLLLLWTSSYLGLSRLQRICTTKLRNFNYLLIRWPRIGNTSAYSSGHVGITQRSKNGFRTCNLWCLTCVVSSTGNVIRIHYQPILMCGQSDIRLGCYQQVVWNRWHCVDMWLDKRRGLLLSQLLKGEMR